MACGLAPHTGKSFCPNCRAETHPQAIVCIKCGIGLSGATAAGGKLSPTGQSMEPAIAALVSFFIPGIGQIILGQGIKGVVILIVGAVLCVFTFCIALLIVSPAAAIDAYLIAQKLKQGKSVGEWEFF